MASLGELVVLWPVPNALVQYVDSFLDKDLATVVGVTYWYDTLSRTKSDTDCSTGTRGLLSSPFC